MSEDDYIFEDFQKFIDEFKDETDRAIVVLTAARLDFLLLTVIQEYLLPNASRIDEFFENQGPGSTFSNKITIVYRLGLVDRDYTRALNLVRSIRNNFAHETSACSLERGSYKDRVNALVGPYKKLPFFTWFKKVYFKGVSPSRSNYMTAVAFLLLRLQYLCEKVKPVNPDGAWSVVTPGMRKPMEEKKQLPQSTAPSSGSKDEGNSK